MKKSIGFFILQLSVALYLFSTGILGLSGRNWFREGEIRQAVTAIFKGETAEILIIVFSVCAVVAALLLLLELFGKGMQLTELLLIVLMVVWAVFIFMVDIYYPLNHRIPNIVDYLRGLGSHLMVLGGMACASKHLGGR